MYTNELHFVIHLHLLFCINFLNKNMFHKNYVQREIYIIINKCVSEWLSTIFISSRQKNSVKEFKLTEMK